MFGNIEPTKELVSLNLLQFDYTPDLIEKDLNFRSKLIDEQVDFLDSFFEKCEQRVKQRCRGNPKKEVVFWKSYLNVTLQYFRKDLLKRYKAEQEIHKLKLEAHRLYFQPFN